MDVEQPDWEVEQWPRSAQAVNKITKPIGIADLQKEQRIGGNSTDQGQGSWGIRVIGRHVHNHQHGNIPDEELQDGGEIAHLVQL